MVQAHGKIQQFQGANRILITRTIDVPAELLWKTFTEATALSGWIGVLRHDEVTGKRTFSMLEGGKESAPEELEITRCRAPHELEFTTTNAHGGWAMGLVITPTDNGAELQFHQILGEQDDPQSMGPGWEYYVQRAFNFTLGKDPETVLWEDFHPALVAAYSTAPTRP